MTDNRFEEFDTLAIVDIGSNSVRMNMYKINPDNGEYSVFSSSRAMLKLVSYKHDGILSADGEGKLISLLREYQAKANEALVDKFIAFATASLRDTKNLEDIQNKIKTKLGIDITVISGDDEARYDYEATRHAFGDKFSQRGVVMDMGGGSTEFIAFDGSRVRHRSSLPIGSLDLWKRFCGQRKDNPFPTEKEITDIENYVRSELRKANEFLSFGGAAYIVGGTARAFAKLNAEILNRGDAKEGYVMNEHDFFVVRNAIVEDIKNGAPLISKVCPDRITSIVPGVLALKVIFDMVGISKAIVSLSGVREGFVAEYVDRKYINKR